MAPKSKEQTAGVNVDLQTGEVTNAAPEGERVGNLNLLPPDTPDVAAKRAAELAAMKAGAKIDFAKPFAVVVDQTESRTNTTIIQGDTVEDVLAKAQAEAEAVTMRTGRPCAYFGPQEGVMMPPEKPVAMKLQFKTPAPAVAPTDEA